jgi:hypothetical protein
VTFKVRLELSQIRATMDDCMLVAVFDQNRWGKFRCAERGLYPRRSFRKIAATAINMADSLRLTESRIYNLIRTLLQTSDLGLKTATSTYILSYVCGLTLDFWGKRDSCPKSAWEYGLLRQSYTFFGEIFFSVMLIFPFRLTSPPAPSPVRRGGVE